MKDNVHAFEAPHQNRFRQLWDLGYRSLIPIIPPDAEISEGSSLYKRLGTRQDGRGKTPGVKGSNGKWFSWDWVPHVADELDLSRWNAMGAGVGVKTGDGLYAIDADSTDEASARIIRDIVQDIVGPSPIRVGRYPKALYLIRASEAIPYTRIEFGPPDGAGNYERVELLGARKQFVAYGTHNKTRKPYEWPSKLTPYDDLPVLDPADLSELFNRLQQHLPDAQRPDSEGDGGPVNQDSLRGDPRTIRAAVEATPNTSDLFPSRESYRDYGYAIKASLPDDEHEAFEIFSEWCGRWAQGENDPDVVASDWRRMKPPFRVGASRVYALAEQHSGGVFSTAQAYFTPLPAQETAPSPFDVQMARERETAASDLYPVLRTSEIIDRPPPSFLIDRFFPQQSFGFLYSAPGVGKSFLILDAALHIAYGFDNWHGDAINVPETEGPPSVLYIAAEGSYGFRNRIRAWQQANNIDPATPNGFLMIERTINFMSPEDIAKLTRTVEAVAPSATMVIVDTVSRAVPGADENLQKEMTLFVSACGLLQERFGCTVVGVHHAGKDGKMRGSTVLNGAGDFVLHLDREKGKTVGNLTCDKQKEAEDGWTEGYAFNKVDLGDDQSSLVVSRVGPSSGPGTDKAPGRGSAVLQLVLEAMHLAWESGEPWGASHQSKDRYAPRKMAHDFGVPADKAEEFLDLWVADGSIELAVCDKRSKRKGYRVIRNTTAPAEHFAPVDEDVFG